MVEDRIAECRLKECAHYIGKDRIGLYRGRFIWTIGIATVIVVVLFVGLVFFYHSSLKTVVDLHSSSSDAILAALQPIKMAPDSCVYVNEQLALSMQEHLETTESLLQLQSQKIQSDFAVLSIWAGILMIVFLVFSIYSIYKTDELLKQGQEGVKNIENVQTMVKQHVQEIDKHVEEELSKVSATMSTKTEEIATDAISSIAQIKQQAEEEKKSFKGMLDEKTTQFQSIYEEYVAKLEETAKANKILTESFMDFMKSGQTVRKSMEPQKEDEKHE